MRVLFLFLSSRGEQMPCRYAWNCSCSGSGWRQFPRKTNQSGFFLYSASRRIDATLLSCHQNAYFGARFLLFKLHKNIKPPSWLVGRGRYKVTFRDEA